MKRIRFTVVALLLITVAELIITKGMGTSLILWIGYGIERGAELTYNIC